MRAKVAVAGGDPGPAGLLGDAPGAASDAACLGPAAAAVGCCAKGVMQREMRTACASLARCMTAMSSSVESPVVEWVWNRTDREG